MEVQILDQHHIISRQIEQIQSRKQIEIFSTFLPDEILMSTSIGNQLRNYDGIVLLIDVSSIYILSRINRNAAQEAISIADASINAYLSAIMEVIFFYGGDIQEFNPDNMTVVWKSRRDLRLHELIDKAVVCSLNVLRVIRKFNEENGEKFQIRQVISCGKVYFGIIGNKMSKSWVMIGEMVEDCRLAIAKCRPADILVTRHAWGHLNADRYIIDFSMDGYVQIIDRVYSFGECQLKQQETHEYNEILSNCIIHLEIRNNSYKETRPNIEVMHQEHTRKKLLKKINPRRSFATTVKSHAIKEIENFMIHPVQDKIKEHLSLEYLSEVCEATIELIHLTPIECDINERFNFINEVYCTIHQIVQKLNGYILGTKMLCNGTILYQVIYGIQSNGDEAIHQNVLKTASDIMKELKSSDKQTNVNIKIFNELVQCSVFGHPFRKSYFVIGKESFKEPKNLINKIICDYKTYEYSKLPSGHFIEHYKSDENSDFDEFEFEYVGIVNKTLENFREIYIIGRNQDLAFIRSIIFNASKDSYPAVVIKGQSKSGKSLILRKIISECEEKSRPLAFVNLCGGKSKPYFCASAIYSQLFNIANNSSKDSSRGILSKKLWHFEEALQMKKSFSEDIHQSMRIFENFLRVCKKNTEFSVIVIDNIQNIDMKSLQLLEDMIKLKVIRLVSAGLFEEDELHILWKFSLSNQFKVMDLEPLAEEFVPELICHFLNVQGVMKKILNLIQKVCDGRPGWIETCLLELINKNDIVITSSSCGLPLEENFIFPYKKNIKFRKNGTCMRLAIMGDFRKCNLRDMSPNSLTLNFFESFPSYQQIIIKTAAVIGDIFTRSLLVFILELPNNNFFTYAMKCLFDEEIFECGSKYFINNAKVITNELSCVCHMKHEDQGLFRDFPKYAFCKILHFRNRILRKIAYELLSANQKKDLHLKITELLEQENMLCPQCSHQSSSAVIKMKKYKDMVVLLEPQESQCTSQLNIKVIKNVIRQEITKSMNEEKQEFGSLSHKNLSFRKSWNRTNCFCLEITTRIYSDLVHHSQRANHLAKQIFFMYQYGSILILIGELEDAIMLLKEASQLCILSDLEKCHMSVEYCKFIFSRIVTAIAEAYYHLDDFKAAKNYILLCFKQHEAPILSFEYKFCLKFTKEKSKSIFDYFYTQSRGLDEYLGQSLSILMRILVAENQWNLALSVAEKSLNLLKTESMNVIILCDVYSSALDIFGLHGDTHICERLEKCVISVLLQLYSTDGSMEIFALVKLMHTLFVMKTKNDSILKAITIGYNLYQLNYILHAEIFQLETVSILADLLVSAKRIEDAVSAMTLTRKMTKNTMYEGDLLYFTFCTDLMLNSSYYIEKIDAIESFVEKNLASKRSHTKDNASQQYLIISLLTYFSRLNNWSKVEKWKSRHQILEIDKKDYIHVKYKIRYLEFNLLQLVRKMKYEKVISVEDFAEIKTLIKECTAIGKNWKYFLPKCLVYQSYFYKLRKKSKHKQFMYLASKQAQLNDNFEVQCWIRLNEKYWTMTHTNLIMTEFPFVFWKKSSSMNFAEWTQILFPLPLP